MLTRSAAACLTVYLILVLRVLYTCSLLHCSEWSPLYSRLTLNLWSPAWLDFIKFCLVLFGCLSDPRPTDASIMAYTAFVMPSQSLGRKMISQFRTLSTQCCYLRFHLFAVGRSSDRRFRVLLSRQLKLVTFTTYLHVLERSLKRRLTRWLFPFLLVHNILRSDFSLPCHDA